VELLDVEPLRLANAISPKRALSSAQGLVYVISGLIAVRLAAAAWLPLSFDEAYYWLWSKHLAAGYYDHPPAIAFAIRAGTTLFGDTALGVRAVPFLFSIGASWAVWRAGARLLKSERGGALACLFFNLSLMTTIETLAATPDAPQMFASALLVWALVELEATQDARRWLAAGAAGGFALGVGVFAWLIGTPEGRRWLATPWPWLAAAIALLMFAPVLWWNAQHDWISFRFQFARAGAGHFDPRYLAELLAGQIALATPGIFVLAAIGLAHPKIRPSPLLGALALPSLLFFTEHALHARVQGNWPSFLYPVISIAAAAAFIHATRAIPLGRLTTFCRRWAAPVAALFLAVAYGQALFGFLPFNDPTARLLADGFEPVATDVAALRDQHHASAVLTANYSLTGWLAFYLPKGIPVVQIDEPDRWIGAPEANASLLHRPAIFVTRPRRNETVPVARDFTNLHLLARLTRRHSGRAAGHYDVYLVSGWRGRPSGHIVNGR
jgi:4-amino-4-deoxy-L-arabinose transferase-like glycosyltransferase